MSIFDNFNNQGLSNEVAFEELCCQLFETWGIRTMKFDACWEYLNIRGAGGDGGIEAYWHSIADDKYIGIQAKWFRRTITPSQYGDIRESIDTARKLRPSLTRYIVCVPHNLTSLRNSRGGTISLGEEEDWKSFRNGIEQSYPGLDLLLWDEHQIGNLLQEPANEGRWRFWFDKSAINPDNVRIVLKETLEGLKDRYVPEISDDGELAVFLDNFFGTIESRSLVIKDIDACLDVCHDLAYVADSFTRVGDELSDDAKDSATKCHDAVHAYADSLYAWRQILVTEPHELIEIDSIAVDYGAIEDFESVIQELKNEYKHTGHADELIRLIDRFRELPGEYEICKTLRNAFSYPHCLVIGEQGTGKTCGFASEASEFLNGRKHLPILIRAGEVNENDGWREIISSALGLSDWSEAELWQALSSSAAMQDTHDYGIAVRGKVTIFVDGLDERQPSSRWTSLIRRGDVITREYPRIRFAYSSRPHGVERDDNIWECIHYVDEGGDVPVWKLFDRYIERYSIDLAGNMRYKWMLRTPMELRMFCTTYSGKRIEEEISTCLTSLVNAEVDRLEEEYTARTMRAVCMHETPVRAMLASLATAFLQDDSPRSHAAISAIADSAGIQLDGIEAMLNFLESYGILATVRRPGATSVSPEVVMYQPGSRHLWDYFMAVVLMETEDITAADTLLRHGDVAFMYAILLIERRHILPLDNEPLVNALGSARVRRLTVDALASSDKLAAGKFRQWSLDELGRSEDSFLEIVNGIVIQVADELDHPLGPTMFDKYMRSFASPAERDRVWSIPRKMYDGYGLSMYYEHDAIKHLPLLHNDDKWNQMPLVLAWCLGSVSNLRRRHCRNELVRWALLNPSEYADLFGHFCTCDDPQMREDLFAIAEEVVCQGKVDVAVKRRFANTVLDAVFRRTDKPGNRNAALRYYGRILVENCLEDGIIEQDEAVVCRPPYGVDAETCTLPIFTEAANSDRMGGYGPIHYDLARYVLVDKLESAFGLPCHIAKSCNDNDDVLTLVEKSAELAGIDAPSFEGWAISATYQYLLDHGYDPDVFEGPVNAGGYRVGGIDRKIARSFGEADHGSQSTVMTVAEKYVWCARNEICGYMADRVPVYTSVCQNGTDHETRELATDYSNLLSFQSPLFETTINRLSTERAEITPSFPAAFSCDNGDEICSEQELNEWIGSGNVDAITALLDHVPNIKLSLEGGIIPIAIYVSDWGVCGKQARAWAYCGAMDHTELSKLSKAGTVAIDGYDHASAFVSGISIGATYISPVEFISAPWVREYDGDREQFKIADLHVVAAPLSGSGVDSLTEIGDCWYRFPSKLAVSLCDVTRTDGARYFDTNDRVMFEDVDYGEPYKKHYQTLYADKNKLFDALGGRGLHPVWYATLQRNGNRLAGERLPQVDARFEASWLIWINDEGEYCSCRMSDEYPIPEHTNDPSDFIKELLESYASSNEEDAESPTE